MTPQRELIFRSFFELGQHVSVDELFAKVRQLDRSVGYSTVWRNLKLICQVGLAEEVNIGDGITRYDRVTESPHGHLFCMKCKKVIEFNVEQIVGVLVGVAGEMNFSPESFKVEIQGSCSDCLDSTEEKIVTDKAAKADYKTGKNGSEKQRKLEAD
ncbi:MAG: transcriptional repressor [Candidatus Krumholzibacteriota bacterium]|nr:transcriptional repressor [Candidatus Krumholzibacteriota bacterium]